MYCIKRAVILNKYCVICLFGDFVLESAVLKILMKTRVVPNRFRAQEIDLAIRICLSTSGILI